MFFYAFYPDSSMGDDSECVFECVFECDFWMWLWIAMTPNVIEVAFQKKKQKIVFLHVFVCRISFEINMV